ncbi:MAG: DNA-3-methyladenine glycosylase I [Bacteroidetes bacterium]|nr:MAG: DNA-3-methyladenine glycosylase I [Bacteroidota bacterium]
MKRCSWCGNDPLYVKYHDEEWGVPFSDDQKMFEFLLLETFQAGLSWITILRKRENFRNAFADFDVDAVANFTAKDIERLQNDPGIIRNRLKIQSAISNAQLIVRMRDEEGIGLSDYFWKWVNHTPVVNSPASLKDVPATSDLSDAISKDLKKRGFKFVGSTVIYAHLQATGIINDHVVDCDFRNSLN